MLDGYPHVRVLKSEGEVVLLDCVYHGKFEVTRADLEHGRVRCMGCEKDERSAGNRRRTPNSVLEKICKKFQHRNDYHLPHLKTELLQPDPVITFVCSIPGHEPTKRKLDVLLQGHGCSTCANRYKNKTGDGWLYFRRFSGKDKFVKIGVTMRSVELRLQGSKVGYGMSHEDIIAPIKTTIASAGAFERLILNNFARHQYIPDKKHLPSGGTDCFSLAASDEIKRFIVDNVHRFKPSQTDIEEPKKDPLAGVFSSDEERDVVFAAIRNKLVLSLISDEAPKARHLVDEIFRAIVKEVFADHELSPLPDTVCQRLLFALSETREEKMYRKSVGLMVIKKLRLARSTLHLLPFEAARRIVQSQDLKSGEDWKAFVRSKRHVELGVPSEPARVYPDKWQGMGDWLGTNRIATQRRTYWEFEAARTFVQTLNLQSVAGWKKFTRDSAFPKELPTNPPMAYKNKGWKTWGDWLGTNFVALQHRDYIRFSKARAYVRCLELRSREEWKAWWAKNRPSNIPQHVASVYRDDGWKGWGDFLGTGFVANQCRTFRPFEDARAFVRPLGIKSQSEWRRYAQSGRKPDDIPANPYTAYFGRGWTHWGDFLGTRTEERKTRRKIKDKVGPFWAKRRSKRAAAEGE